MFRLGPIFPPSPPPLRGLSLKGSPVKARKLTRPAEYRAERATPAGTSMRIKGTVRASHAGILRTRRVKSLNVTVLVRCPGFL
jgi:hypothetical protein